MFRKTTILASLLALPSLPMSNTNVLKSQTVYLVVVDNAHPDWSYFRTDPLDTNNNEQGNAFIIDLTTDKGRNMFALVLTAKSANKKVRIECGTCNLSQPSKDFGGWGTTITGVGIE